MGRYNKYRNCAIMETCATKPLNLPHETEWTAIKVVPVDKSIVPVVKWLNSFDGIYTIFSCEGETGNEDANEEKREDQPYILFYCSDVRDLIDVCHCPYAEVIVDFHAGMLRYRMTFYSKEHMYLFIEIIS